MKKVLVMLASYNGEKYLREQLDSIYNQKGVEIHLLVRDDGSKDNTITILEEYKDKYGNTIILKEHNVGSAMCFCKLINFTVNHLHDFDYYSFSDQDDVWFENKLLTAINMLDKSDNQFKFFNSGVLLVNEDLNKISHKNVIDANRNFASSLISNHSLGCTQVFNFKLLEYINKYYNAVLSKKEHLIFHDAISNRIAFMMNAHYVYWENPLIYYRQHENNVIGSPISNLTLLKQRLKRFFKSQNVNMKSKLASNLLWVFGDSIPAENKKILEKCSCYNKSMISKMRLLLSHEFYNQGIRDNIGTFILILSGRF